MTTKFEFGLVALPTRPSSKKTLQAGLNGTRVSNATELKRLLDGVRDREPFFVELVGENGFKLLLGIGVPEACVQFSPTDGSTPYLMAVVRNAPNAGEGEICFLIGDTPSPVPKRFSLPYETMVGGLRQIAALPA